MLTATVGCLAVPYVINMVVAAIFFVIFTALNTVTCTSNFEMNPLDEGLLSGAHSRVDVSTSP